MQNEDASAQEKSVQKKFAHMGLKRALKKETLRIEMRKGYGSEMVDKR
jgi:hypothetical protein